MRSLPPAVPKRRSSKQWILAIDQGTTGTRSLIVGPDGLPKALAYRTHRQIFPKLGWVEHDPEEIWRAVRFTMDAALHKARLKPTDLAGIGIANQGETVMAWDAQTSLPVGNAIVWQCDRTRRAVDRVKRDGKLSRRIHRISGLVPDCYFSASKIRWIYDHTPECRRLARAGRLRVGTLDSWLIWKLTEGREFLTDTSTASRTLLMDIKRHHWSEVLLQIFRVSPEWLPSIRPTIGEFGTAVLNGVEVPILASAVDQQSALFGQCCFRAGSAKCTFGTGAFLLMHTGAAPCWSRHGLLTTVACSTEASTTYALDGGIYTAGAALTWMRDKLGLLTEDAEAGELAASVPDAAGVTFIPSLAGLAAPYWERGARGAVYGLSTSTTRANIVRALLEGIALRVVTIAETMAKESGQDLTARLRADGGLTRNAWLMQFLADVLNVPIEVPACDEATALGIAYMAGLKAGIFRSEAQLEKQWRCARRYEPAMSLSERQEHIARHKRAVKQVIAWGCDA